MKSRSATKRMRQLALSYDLISKLVMSSQGFKKASLLRLVQGYLQYQFLPHYFTRPPKWRMLLRRFAGRRALPDFGLIGIPKGGSSDLAVSIMSHPNVLGPIVKEFISLDPEGWRTYYPTERKKRSYAKLNGRVLCPYLAPFMHHMELVDRFAHTRPNAKIILVLRDPAQRVYSQWKWEYLLAGPSLAPSLPFLRTFSEYVNKALESFPDVEMYTGLGYPALQTSIYYRSVQSWINAFDSKQVLVLDVADHFGDRNLFLNRICAFLEIPPFEFPDPPQKTNENLLKLPPPDDESLNNLKAFFQPYNERLWDVIGERFNW